MDRTTLFKSDGSQLVRLGDDVAFRSHVRDVVVLKDGLRRILVPFDAVWDDFFAWPGSDLPERNQPAAPCDWQSP